MLQSVHDCKKFYWGTKWVPAELVVGGDQPFVRRLIGVSVVPMVDSIYNMRVWDKVAAAWVKAGVRRTLEGESVARRRYHETGLSLEDGGCVGDPHVVVERCLVFLCILHCCMAMGRLQVAFIEACLGDLPKDNAVGVQRVLYWARTSVRLGASASLDGEEARALFLTCEELGPLLAYAPEDDEWQAVVAMRDLLRDERRGRRRRSERREERGRARVTARPVGGRVKAEESGEVVVDEGGDAVLEGGEGDVVEANPPTPPPS